MTREMFYLSMEGLVAILLGMSNEIAKLPLNWLVELVSSFMTFRAAPGAALKEISTTLRSINFGVGVPPGFPVVATLWPGDGVDDAPRSSGNG